MKHDNREFQVAIFLLCILCGVDEYMSIDFGCLRLPILSHVLFQNRKPNIVCVLCLVISIWIENV